MDMSSSMTMSMDMASTTASAAAAATSAASDHGGMDMGGGSGDGPSCKISMLWNWYTIDACFLSDQWHIRSAGTFAVTCIAVMLMVVLLEFLRRLGKEYDALILRKFRNNAASRLTVTVSHTVNKAPDGEQSDGSRTEDAQPATILAFRPSLVQQIIRSVIHMCTFGVAYIVMLLAMYFNGYIILMIFLGALLGKFFCDWGSQQVVIGAAAGLAQAQGEQELTYCCG